MLLCALPTAFGFGAISAIALCGVLAAEFVKKSLPHYVTALIFTAFLMFFANYDNIYYFVAYFALIAVISFCIGASIKGKKNLSHIVVSASMCAITVFLILIVYNMRTYNISAVSAIFGIYFETLREAAPLMGDVAPQFTALISTFEKQIDQLLPSLIIVAGALFSYISFGIARKIIEKNSQKLDIRPFFLLRLAPSFTFIFIIADMISMFMGTNMFFANASVVLSTLFTVCGISVFDFYLRAKNINTFFRTVIYVAAFMLIAFTGLFGSLATTVLHFVGIWDSLRPLRRINSNKF